MSNHPCNTCGRETVHYCEANRTYTRMLDGKEIDVFIEFLYCAGCNTPTTTKMIYDNFGNPRTNYYPPRLWLTFPQWMEQLESRDPTLYELLKEIYSAANDKQFRLLAMGVRTALDYTMTSIVGDIGGFERKLEKMVSQGHLTPDQSDMLATTIDAGSAASHRGFKPPKDLLEQMLSVMDMIIRQHYITKPMLARLKVNIPPRP